MLTWPVDGPRSNVDVDRNCLDIERAACRPSAPRRQSCDISASSLFYRHVITVEMGRYVDTIDTELTTDTAVFTKIIDTAMAHRRRYLYSITQNAEYRGRNIGESRSIGFDILYSLCCLASL